MESGAYPRLCGGTFFTLLPKALKQRRKARDRYNGGSDGLSHPDILIGLIRVVQPTYLAPAASTFAQNTSAYKSCAISSGTYLPFNDPSFTTPFDTLVQTNYNCALARMAEFIDNFIDIENTIKSENLVKALLELIKADQSITDNDAFYVNSGGQALNKEAVCALTDICLQPFLLGVWHFIIMSRQDNEVGRATFEEWHEAPEMKGQQWRFISSIGEDAARTVNVMVLNLTADDAGPEAASSTGYDSSEKYEEPYVEDSGSTNSGTTNQIVNTPAVFINHGADCMQINNTGTLNIDRRRG